MNTLLNIHQGIDMFIEIESTKKKAEIENIEFEKNQITFFLDNFFYLHFETESEKANFISEFLKNAISPYSNGQSFVEIGESLINSYQGWNNFILQDATKLNVKSYIFVNQNNSLEVIFSSGKEELKFVLYKQIIDKLMNNLK